MNAKVKAAIIENLRIAIRPQRKQLSMSDQSFGIPAGAITAISGHGKTTFVARFLAEHPNCKVAWIEKKFSIYPFAFLQKKITLDRILFVEAGQDCEWVCLQVLKSQIFPIVVMYTTHLSLKCLRRIQLAAEKAEASIIWLAHQPQLLWPISLELEVDKTSNELNISVLRQRL